MAKYLVRASYTAAGAKGLLEKGGSARRKAAEELLAAFGGKLEVFYFAFGSDDASLSSSSPTK